MELEVRPAPVGAKIVDSNPFSLGGTFPQALALKQAGCEGVAVYLGGASKVVVQAILEAGMGCFGVTYGNTFDGVASVKQARGLGLPPGVTLFLDMEGKDDVAMGPLEVKLRAREWALAVDGAGYIPGLYVGSPQVLSTLELHELPVYRYWRGQGRIVDYQNRLAEPTNGWCMTQMYPSVTVGSVLVDWNMVGQDYKGRVPHLVYRKAT